MIGSGLFPPQLQKRGDRIKDFHKRERKQAMIDNAQLLSASQWAHATFAEARLGDQRRTKRVVHMATLMATQSDVSLPRMMKSKAERKRRLSIVGNTRCDLRRVDASSCTADPATSGQPSTGLVDPRYHRPQLFASSHHHRI